MFLSRPNFQQTVCMEYKMKPTKRKPLWSFQYIHYNFESLRKILNGRRNTKFKAVLYDLINTDVP